MASYYVIYGPLPVIDWNEKADKRRIAEEHTGYYAPVERWPMGPLGDAVAEGFVICYISPQLNPHLVFVGLTSNAPLPNITLC